MVHFSVVFSIKKGATVEILFQKDKIDDYYKIQPTILKFKHNLKEKMIESNTISTKNEDRLTPMSIKFSMNQDVNIDLLLTRPITPKTHVYCLKNETQHLKLYTLDEAFEKDILYKEVYRNSSRIHTNIDLRKIDSKNLLLECYSKDSNLKYQGILHLSKNEFWNFSKYPTAFYKANEMTDFYYYGIKAFIKQGFSFLEAREKSEKITRNLFSHYPKKWGIGEATNYGSNITESDTFLSDFNTQLEFIKNYKNNMANNIIFDELKKYSFDGGSNINKYIKAHFFPDTLNAIANEHTPMWYEVKNITTDRTGGTVQVVEKNTTKSVIIDFESNRGSKQKQSQVALVQDINIANINKNNLYLTASINRIEGLSEKKVSMGQTPDCTGQAIIKLAYFDNYNQFLGSTILVNMEDSIASLIDTTGILTNAITLDDTNTTHIIKLKKTKYDRLVVDINHEVKLLPNIIDINRIKTISVSLLVQDFFTEGPSLSRTGIVYPSCNQAKAFLEVSKIGIYNYEI